MQPDSGSKGAAQPHRIELNLRDMNQFLNTMDPSPFHASMPGGGTGCFRWTPGGLPGVFTAVDNLPE